METGDIFLISVLMIGQIGGMIWSIYNWNNKDVESHELFYGLFAGWAVALLFVGVAPIILMWLLSVAIGELRNIN